MNIAIIGLGNMGLTYAHSFINANIIRPSQLYIINRSPKRLEELLRLTSHAPYQSPGPFIQDMDLVILSVKPQDYATLSGQLEPYILPGQLILSIMAGISMQHIRETLGSLKVIRAMPNLPAQVGQGMTVFTTTPEVSRIELLSVHNLLNTTGKTLYAENEMMIDAATAISGSGPGYVFFVMNSMMEIARQMGFTDSEAQLLVRQTVLGSIDLLNQNDLDCEAWIQRVASKGGTTEAAIRAFRQFGLSRALEEGLGAAYERARELSGH